MKKEGKGNPSYTSKLAHGWSELPVVGPKLDPQLTQ